MIDYLRVKLRSLIADKKGLETLEYAVFAVAFVVVIGGVVTGLTNQMKLAYGDIGNWIAGQAKLM